MPNDLYSPDAALLAKEQPALKDESWHTFEEILSRLHAEGIYIDADQLAAFLLHHGLPVHLRYVPPHLRDKAMTVNQSYQGDMAQLIEEWDYPYSEFNI
jgi:hypothetical protein